MGPRGLKKGDRVRARYENGKIDRDVHRVLGPPDASGDVPLQDARGGARFALHRCFLVRATQ